MNYKRDSVTCLEQGFPTAVLLAFGAGWFFVVSSPVLCSAFSLIPGLHPLDASSSSPPQFPQPKCLQTDVSWVTKVSWWGNTGSETEYAVGWEFKPTLFDSNGRSCWLFLFVCLDFFLYLVYSASMNRCILGSIHWCLTSCLHRSQCSGEVHFPTDGSHQRKRHSEGKADIVLGFYHLFNISGHDITCNDK